MDDANYKNFNDLETTHNHRRHPTVVPSTSSQDFKGSTGREELFNRNLEGSSSHDHEVIGKASFLATGDQGGHKSERSSTSPPAPPQAMAQPVESRKMVVTEEEEEEISVREKLKGLRLEVSSAGSRVWIPDTWGQEDLLKNWIDCTVFDSSLDKTSIMSAREALIQDVGRST